MHRIFARLGIFIVIAATIATAGAAWKSDSSSASTAPRLRVSAQADSRLLAAATAALPRLAGDENGIAYGPQPYQVLDLRLPDPITYPGLRPVIIYVHSGGWISGERNSVPEVALAQVARGYALVTIDYQLATLGSDGQNVSSFPGAIWDVKRAIRTVKANAGIWAVDPQRVILMGASAGGHLAAFVGATAGQYEPPELPTTSNPSHDSSVAAIVDFVGPTNLETFERTDHPWAAPLTASFLGCAATTPANLFTCPDAIVNEASVAPHVDKTDPPIYLAYGADDALVVAATQGAPLAQVWLDAHHGNPTSTTYLVIEGAGHTLPYEDTVVSLTNFFDHNTQQPTPRNNL